jgi:hypothetical protein
MGDTSKNKVKIIIFMVHWFSTYQQENRSDTASSATSSQPITGTVSQFLQSYTSHLLVQAQ